MGEDVGGFLFRDDCGGWMFEPYLRDFQHSWFVSNI